VAQGGQGGGLAEAYATQRLLKVLPRRWVLERTFAWISHNRRMSKDYERLCVTGEAFVYAAMTRLIVRRLARA
jgi:putative transposase